LIHSTEVSSPVFSSLCLCSRQNFRITGQHIKPRERTIPHTFTPELSQVLVGKSGSSHIVQRFKFSLKGSVTLKTLLRNNLRPLQKDVLGGVIGGVLFLCVLSLIYIYKIRRRPNFAFCQFQYAPLNTQSSNRSPRSPSAAGMPRLYRLVLPERCFHLRH
jgi:hypothetical protein